MTEWKDVSLNDMSDWKDISLDDLKTPSLPTAEPEPEVPWYWSNYITGPLIGAGEAVANAVTGMGLGLPAAGFAEIPSLIAGESPEKALERGEQVGKLATYEPRSPYGKAYSDLIGKAFRALSWLPREYFGAGVEHGVHALPELVDAGPSAEILTPEMAAAIEAPAELGLYGVLGNLIKGGFKPRAEDIAPAVTSDIVSEEPPSPPQPSPLLKPEGPTRTNLEAREHALRQQALKRELEKRSPKPEENWQDIDLEDLKETDKEPVTLVQKPTYSAVEPKPKEVKPKAPVIDITTGEKMVRPEHLVDERLELTGESPITTKNMTARDRLKVNSLGKEIDDLNASIPKEGLPEAEGIKVLEAIKSKKKQLEDLYFKYNKPEEVKPSAEERGAPIETTGGEKGIEREGEKPVRVRYAEETGLEAKEGKRPEPQEKIQTEKEIPSFESLDKAKEDYDLNKGSYQTREKAEAGAEEFRKKNQELEERGYHTEVIKVGKRYRHGIKLEIELTPEQEKILYGNLITEEAMTPKQGLEKLKEVAPDVIKWHQGDESIDINSLRDEISQIGSSFDSKNPAHSSVTSAADKLMELINNKMLERPVEEPIEEPVKKPVGDLEEIDPERAEEIRREFMDRVYKKRYPKDQAIRMMMEAQKRLEEIDNIGIDKTGEDVLTAMDFLKNQRGSVNIDLNNIKDALDRLKIRFGSRPKAGALLAKLKKIPGIKIDDLNMTGIPAYLASRKHSERITFEKMLKDISGFKIEKRVLYGKKQFGDLPVLARDAQGELLPQARYDPKGRWSNITLSGDIKNYKETLFKLEGNKFHEQHFGEEGYGVFATNRSHERTMVDGSETLHADEVQSVQAERGSVEGFRGEAKQDSKIAEEINNLRVQVEDFTNDMNRILGPFTLKEFYVKDLLKPENIQAIRRLIELQKNGKLESSVRTANTLKYVEDFLDHGDPGLEMVITIKSIGEMTQLSKELGLKIEADKSFQVAAIKANIRYRDRRIHELGAKSEGTGVPNMPFKKDWYKLVMRDHMNEAIEKGKDGISWNTAKILADRYNKFADEMRWDYDGEIYRVDLLKDGVKIRTPGEYEHFGSTEEIGNLLGKNIRRIVEKQEDSGKISGAAIGDILVDADMFKRLYDKQIPKMIKSEYGVKPELKETNAVKPSPGGALFEEPNPITEKVWYAPITDKVRSENGGTIYKKGIFSDLLEAKTEVENTYSNVRNIINNERGSIEIDLNDLNRSIKEKLQPVKDFFDFKTWPDSTSEMYKNVFLAVRNHRINNNVGMFEAQKLSEYFRELVPDLETREKITDYIDRPVLKFFAADSMEAHVVDAAKKVFDSYKKQFEDLGMLDQFVDDYVPHIIKKTPKNDFITNADIAKFQRRSRKNGIWRTIRELEKEGYVLEKDIANLVPQYVYTAEKAIANKTLATYLMNAKTKAGERVLLPVSEVPLGEKGVTYHQFRDDSKLRSWARLGRTKGKEARKAPPEIRKLLSETIYIHRDAFHTVENVMGSSTSEVYSKIAQVRSGVKRMIMYNPLIHGFNFESNVMSTLGLDYPSLVKTRYKWLANLDEAAVHGIAKDFVLNGGELVGLYNVSKRLGADIYEMRPLDKITWQRAIENPKLVLRNPIRSFVDINDQVLWDKWIKTGQLLIYKVAKERMLAEGLSEKEAGFAAADLANDLSGAPARTWFTLRQRKALTALMFAKSWNTGLLRTLTGALPHEMAKSAKLPKFLRFEGLSDKQLRSLSKEYRKVLLKGIVGAVATANLIQAGLLAANGKPFHSTFMNESGHELDIDTGIVDDEGRKIYVKNWMFRQVDDYVKALRGHIGRMIISKSEPVARTILGLLANNKIGQGKEIRERGMSVPQQIGAMGKYIIEGITPLDMFIPHEDEVKNWYDILMPLTGTWIRRGMKSKDSVVAGDMVKDLYDWMAKDKYKDKLLMNEIKKEIKKGNKKQAVALAMEGMRQGRLTDDQFLNAYKKIKVPFWTQIAGPEGLHPTFIRFLLELDEKKKRKYIRELKRLSKTAKPSK